MISVKSLVGIQEEILAGGFAKKEAQSKVC
jgi:hypothetical protein